MQVQIREEVIHYLKVKIGLVVNRRSVSVIGRGDRMLLFVAHNSFVAQETIPWRVIADPQYSLQARNTAARNIAIRLLANELQEGIYQ
jgi:hypothetical protein